MPQAKCPKMILHLSYTMQSRVSPIFYNSNIPTSFIIPSSQSPCHLHHHHHLPLRPTKVNFSLCRSIPPRRPPPVKDSRHVTGFAGTLVRLQERVQIFLAVLFWMSLFFWASTWDGRNRPNKGSRFKKMK